MVVCPTCGGGGEHVVCPRGCDGSHVMDATYPCQDCGGDGQVPADAQLSERPPILPGALVLLDVDGPRRGSRAVVLRMVHAPVGDGVTVEVCVGPCARAEHSVDCCSAIALHPDELLLIPAQATT